MSVVSTGCESAEFMLSFGRFIILWNHAELAARDILSTMAGGNITATVLANQAGNTTLTDVIRLTSDWHPDAKTHLIHFSNFMDRVRPYRNYYVHNLMGVMPLSETKEPIGIVMTLNVKGKYVLYEKALRVPDVDAICEYCESLREYGNSILDIIKNNDDMIDRVEPFALLEKPHLPETLTKTVRDPQAP